MCLFWCLWWCWCLCCWWAVYLLLVTILWAQCFPNCKVWENYLLVNFGIIQLLILEHCWIWSGGSTQCILWGPQSIGWESWDHILTQSKLPLQWKHFFTVFYMKWPVPYDITSPFLHCLSVRPPLFDIWLVFVAVVFSWVMARVPTPTTSHMAKCLFTFLCRTWQNVYLLFFCLLFHPDNKDSHCSMIKSFRQILHFQIRLKSTKYLVLLLWSLWDRVVINLKSNTYLPG